MILEKTVELIKQIYRSRKIPLPRINRVVIGLGYTGVEIATFTQGMMLGLAYTLPSVINKTDCSKIDFPGRLTDFHVEDILGWSHGPPSLKKIVGVAMVSALSQHLLTLKNPYQEIKGDLFKHLKVGKNTKICFIGLVKPMVKRASQITQLITVVENNPAISGIPENLNLKSDVSQLEGDDLSTDVLICTGTALINDTLEEILSLFRRTARKIVIIGPTAGILPDILFDQGVDIVGGMRIKDIDATIKVLMEGGGTRFFKEFGKKYNLIKE